MRTYWLPMLGLLTTLACTEVTQNLPEGGCAPDKLKCSESGDLLKCKEDGTGFEVLKQCKEESPCGGDPPNCEAKVEETVDACSSSEECVAVLGDIGSCRIPVCAEGVCVVQLAMDGGPCDDGTVCTESDSCLAGVCVGKLIDCSDQNPCTADVCDPAEGCSNPVVEDGTAVCTDGDPCTKNDQCVAGACEGSTVECDDGNECTDDLCDKATGACVNLAKTGPCDDGNECTDDDSCIAGKCVGVKACPCQVDKDCETYAGDDPCAAKLTCVDSWCEPLPGSGYQCPQSGLGPCELNQCFGEDGKPVCKIMALPDGTPCDDGNKCTKDDVCQEQECKGAIDVNKSGCGAFLLRWGVVSPASQGGSPDGQILRTTVGAPVIWGASQNEEFDLKVRAIGPGL